MSSSHGSDWIKPMSFYGSFYPSPLRKLEAMMAEFEEEASTTPEPPGRIVGILAPHAGYVFSGLTAARAYWAARRSSPETIILLGLSHQTSLKGISILDASACETPFGELRIDTEMAAALAERLPFHTLNREAHLREHSIETQFPFIKRTFPKAKAVEILTQDDDWKIIEPLAEAIAQTASLSGRRALIAASTDLSHYPPMNVAKRVDKQALEAILTLDANAAEKEISHIEKSGAPGLRCSVCSKAALYAGMLASRKLGANQAHLLGYTNSGDSPYGEKSGVVGYGAAAFCEIN